MSVHLQDEEAFQLAQAIAQQTGQTVAQVITEALRERYPRMPKLDQKASVEELLAIAQGITAQMRGGDLDHAALLYDETGLPG